MKTFFSLEKFKEIKVLLILELIMLLLLIMLYSVNEFNINIFDVKACAISLFVWGLSSLIDKDKYFNLATFIGTTFINYFVFWFMFNLHIT